MKASDSPLLAMASCTPEAFRIAEHSLAVAAKDVRLKRIPLLGDHDPYPSYAALTERALKTTQALLETQSPAILAMCVLREYVAICASRSRKIFSVGLIGACYGGGPVGIFSAEDWVPVGQDVTFRHQAQAVLEKIQTDNPPTSEALVLAEIVGKSLMEYLIIPSKIEEEVSLN